jgi:hypothetical protein
MYLQFCYLARVSFRSIWQSWKQFQNLVLNIPGRIDIVQGITEKWG